MWRAFGGDQRGSVAIIFAFGSIVLFGLAGGGVDYARLASRRSALQNAVDAGVLAGGNALKLANATQASVAGITEQAIREDAKPPDDRPFTVTVTVAADKTSVLAQVQETVKLSFGKLMGWGSQTLTVKAKASVVGKMRLCLLTLDPAAPGALNLQKKAQVTADGCALYSDSADAKGMVGGDSAYARAQTICSAGGYSADRANFAPTPQAGCPVIKDPLKDRAAPAIGSCITIPASANSKGDTSKNLVDRNATLDPGTYCGGLHITNNAVVSLRAGTYVMNNGPLIVDKNATLTGIDVGFYFLGDKAGLVFDKKTTISLTAPTTGTMAGLLMAENLTVTDPVDPTDAVALGYGETLLPPPAPLGATKPMRLYRIISDNARTMLGTIYLPAGRLVIDASKPVADQSAYTVIVAAQVNLYEGPNLYLNANYDATSVPVPKGVGPLAGRILLTQ